MKMVFIAYLRGFGGAQRQIINVANAMSRMGHDVALISMSDNKKCYEIDQAIHYKYIKDHGAGPLKLLNRYKGLKKVLLDIKPDIIINFWLQSAYFTAIMKNKLSCKTIYSERGDPGDKQYDGLLGLIRKICFNKMDGFVFQTNAAKNCFSKDIQNRSTVIPNAVSVKTSKSVYENKKKTIVSVGRLHEQKNLPLLINSFKEVVEKHPDYQLLIYGDGELKDELQEMIIKKELKDKAYLCGSAKDIHDKIKDADMFVLSSDYEGMPNALIEAMMLGIPCISTNWAPGGVVDIIKNRENGIIVERNNKEKLAKAIMEVIEDTDLRNNISINSKKVVEKYNPGVIFDKWNVFLKRIVGENLHE